MPDFTIRGNPESIRARATMTSEKGTLFDDTGAALSKIDTAGWTGRAADHFRDAHDLEPDRWYKAGNGFRIAGAALLTYADALAQAQTTAEWAQGEHDRGDTESGEYRGWFDSETQRLQNGLANGTYSSITLPVWNDPGSAIRSNAVTEFEAARATLENAAQVCAGEVKAGCSDAPEEPSWWESGLKFVGGIFQGAGEAIWDIATMLPFSPANLIQDAWKLATGELTPEELAKTYELSLDTVGDMWDALQDDPVEFGKNLGKGLLDWDTWADDPARAIGHLVPDAIAAIATGGTGTAATRGAGSVDDIADGLRAIDRLADVSALNRLDDLGDLGDLSRLGGLDDLGDLGDLGRLADAEYGSIRLYTGSAYDEINSHLRGADATLGIRSPDELTRISDDISSGLDNLPPYDGTTFRGTDLPDGVLDDIHPGGSYSDPAFSSTSESADVAQTFRGDGNAMFHIDGHSGRDIQDISIFDKSEAEVLFDKGHEFQVVDKVWNDAGGYWDIYLRD